jgi:K+-transporting ATPase ATPase A chain
MTANDFLQLLAFAIALALISWLLAYYITKVYSGRPMALDVIFGPFERLLHLIAGQQASRQQNWLQYTLAVLVFNAVGGVFLFLILLFQSQLPWNPQQLPDLSVDLAFDVAAAFTTNTDWQSYAGETTLSYFSQMMGLTVQNFLSAATGVAVAMAVVRGFMRKETPLLGNFYNDVIRATVYILLPLAFVFALFLIWQGVPQTMESYVQATTVEGVQQTIATGPAASQIAIKMLGSNGGGFFNANAAHPYENPTPLSNFVQLLSILALPVALVLVFGRMIGDKRQGRALLQCMTLLFVILFGLCWISEAGGNPNFTKLSIDQGTGNLSPGGNMEGKEVRFGIVNSALWATATTATSNGSVNTMHDSLTPLGGFVALFNMLTGEVIYGGIGCGLYGILIYVLLTVFIAGLMVGRTPEYLGKKIEAYEIKLAVFAQLLYPICVLGFGVVSLLMPIGAKSMSIAGPHGLSQTIYAYASAAANNGSAFAGFNANTPFQNTMLGIVMLIGRFGIIVPVLAIAGSLAAKKTIPASSGTFPTHGLLFIALLASVIVMLGGLTYFPALALGPIAEHLSLFHPSVSPSAL